jgi:hypothetical protein
MRMSDSFRINSGTADVGGRIVTPAVLVKRGP